MNRFAPCSFLLAPLALLLAWLGATAPHPVALGAGANPSSPGRQGAFPDPVPAASPRAAPVWTFKIVNTYPHDPQAFTQGLVFEDGILYESTGLLGRSSVRRVDLKTGAVLQLHRLPAQLFGEGLTVFGDRLIQLTWQTGVGFVYDKRSFRLLEEFRYQGEGWGLTHDGKRLIMSDGTATLRFLHPETYGEVGRITVFDENGPVAGLNELEFVRGEVYANVWPSSRIIRIDPASGRIRAWLDLDALLHRNAAFNPDAVLNGIAYDPRGDRLFVTGKLWAHLYEIRVVPPPK